MPETAEITDPHRLAAVRRYQEAIESAEDEALPLLVVTDANDQTNLIVMPIPPGMTGASMLRVVHSTFVKSGEIALPAKEAVFSSEVWHRTFHKGLDGPEEEMAEGYVVAGATADEAWTITQDFVRTRDGVRWITEPKQIPTGGDLVPALLAFVRP